MYSRDRKHGKIVCTFLLRLQEIFGVIIKYVSIYNDFTLKIIKHIHKFTLIFFIAMLPLGLQIQSWKEIGSSHKICIL